MHNQLWYHTPSLHPSSRSHFLLKFHRQRLGCLSLVHYGWRQWALRVHVCIFVVISCSFHMIGSQDNTLAAHGHISSTLQFWLQKNRKVTTTNCIAAVTVHSYDESVWCVYWKFYDDQWMHNGIHLTSIYSSKSHESTSRNQAAVVEALYSAIPSNL